MSSRHTRSVINRYEQLRKMLDELDEKANAVDAEMQSLEQILPENYVYPGDAFPHGTEEVPRKSGVRRRRTKVAMRA